MKTSATGVGTHIVGHWNQIYVAGIANTPKRFGVTSVPTENWLLMLARRQHLVRQTGKWRVLGIL